jgi:hypothetical protein
MKRLFSIAIAVLSVQFCLPGQPGTMPVPAKWLRDGRLDVPELNFSIASPSPDAKWSYRDDLPKKVDGSGSTAFLVGAGDGSNYVVMVLENSTKMDSTDTGPFIAGMQKTLPKDWEIRDARLEASDVPAAGSSKFKVAIGLPNGSAYYAYGYVVSGNRSYQTMTFSRSSDEPPAFTRFARSFALLHPIANQPLPNFSGIFLLLAVWGAIVDWRYRRRGGVKAGRSAKMFGLAAVGLGLAVLVFLGAWGASAYYLGSATATIGALLFFLWELARWRVRRKNPVPVAGSHEAKPQEGIVYTDSELEAMRGSGQDGPST